MESPHPKKFIAVASNPAGTHNPWAQKSLPTGAPHAPPTAHSQPPPAGDRVGRTRSFTAEAARHPKKKQKREQKPTPGKRGHQAQPDPGHHTGGAW